MVDFRNLEIPDEVVSPKDYRVAMALKENPVLKNTLYLASTGEYINIGWLPATLSRKIEHLSPGEQEEILELKHRYSAIRAKIAVAMAKAYGHAGRYRGKTREEFLGLPVKSPFEKDVIELLGKMFTTEEVLRILTEDNHVECTEEEIKSIFRKNITEIEKKREKFRNEVADVRLYNKRPRLEELAWMYAKMKTRFNTLQSSDSYNAMLRTLEQIRKEAEGDILTLQGGIDVNIEANIQAQIQKEIFKTLNIKEIIIGRVAARMNFDPVRLLAGLHNSIYAKFVDLGGDYEEGAEMEYPSNKAYDFAEIERTAEATAIDVTDKPLTEEQHTSAMGIKEKFLERIRKQKKEMENRRSVANDIVAEKFAKSAEKEETYTGPRKSGSDDDRPLSKKTYPESLRMKKQPYKGKL